MTDRIVLKGLKFFGRHGVFPGEREQGQVFEVDVDLLLDLQPAGKSDDLSQTVDYARVAELVGDVVTGGPYSLIETVAEKIAALLLESFRPVREVRVAVRKPQAPVKADLEYVGVEIFRKRQESASQNPESRPTVECQENFLVSKFKKDNKIPPCPITTGNK